MELHLAFPKALGGKEDGQNPEQLFAMGYAGVCIYASHLSWPVRFEFNRPIPLACFLSALQMVAGQTGKTDMARNAVVHTQVHIGEPKDLGGFGLEVEIQVDGVEDSELIEAAHKVGGPNLTRFT